MARLSKHDVELLLDGYDADPVAALERGLRVALDLPDNDWTELVEAAPLDPGFRRALLARDTTALDRLTRELNEQRSL
jgi:hypothetical protein